MRRWKENFLKGIDAKIEFLQGILADKDYIAFKNKNGQPK
jgi:hypothetical protein